jgi:hypothetical protein
LAEFGRGRDKKKRKLKNQLKVVASSNRVRIAARGSLPGLDGEVLGKVVGAARRDRRNIKERFRVGLQRGGVVVRGQGNLDPIQVRGGGFVGYQPKSQERDVALMGGFPNLAEFQSDPNSLTYQSRTPTGKVVIKRKGKRRAIALGVGSLLAAGSLAAFLLSRRGRSTTTATTPAITSLEKKVSTSLDDAIIAPYNSDLALKKRVIEIEKVQREANQAFVDRIAAKNKELDDMLAKEFFNFYPNLAQFQSDPNSPTYQSRTPTGKIVIKRKGKKKPSFVGGVLQGAGLGAGAGAILAAGHVPGTIGGLTNLDHARWGDEVTKPRARAAIKTGVGIGLASGVLVGLSATAIRRRLADKDKGSFNEVFPALAKFGTYAETYQRKLRRRCNGT